MIPILLAVPVLLVGAVLALTFRSNRTAAIAAIATQTVACMMVLTGVVPLLNEATPVEITWAWSPPLDQISFRADALSGFFLGWSLPLTLCGTIYAVGYLAPYFAKQRHGGPHFALLNMVSTSFILIYTAQSALVFLLAWEIAAVSAWLLVIWDYRKQKVRFAGFNYLVSTHVGLFVLVAAFMLLHSKTDSMEFAAFGRFLSSAGPGRGVIFLLLGSSFALKSAFFPFHTWLPRAHAAAPAHVSALMSGVIHKAGLFAFLRFTLLMGRPDEWMGWSVLSFGALSAFFGVLYSTTQRDLKRLLGYSSTENVGIAAMGFGLGYLGWSWNNPVLVVVGFGGGLLHILNHAIFKCLTFYAAGAVYRATHSVDIERLGGLSKTMPKTSGLFLLGALAMAGLPPLSGFASEFLIYSGLLAGGATSASSNAALVGLAAILAFVGGVGAFSATRAFGIAFLGNPRDSQVHPGEDPPKTMLAPMMLHAVATILLGLVPDVGIGLLRTTLDLFPVGSAMDVALKPLHAMVWASRLLTVALLVVMAIQWYRSRRAPAATQGTWGCGYQPTSSRMQYTGSSYTEQLARVLESFLPSVRRGSSPKDTFPRHPVHMSTHHPDPVESRVFEVLAQGDDFVQHTSDRIPEQPRFAFGAVLFAIVLIGALLLGTRHPW